MFKTLAAGAVITLTLLSSAAQAHPKVHAATPAVGGTVAASPAELRISFTESVFPKFSGLVLKNQAGAVVKTGKARVDAADAKVLIVPVSATLTPGVYTVAWHAVSADTHRVQGTYTFKVGG